MNDCDDEAIGWLNVSNIVNCSCSSKIFLFPASPEFSPVLPQKLVGQLPAKEQLIIESKNNSVEETDENHTCCICGLLQDDNTMIQCSECKIWQHSKCLGVYKLPKDYSCVKCLPREVDYGVPLPAKHKAAKESSNCSRDLLVS